MMSILWGLAFALVAVSVTMITGNPIYDAIGSIVIGVLLIIAVMIGVEVKNLLIGQSVDPFVKDELKKFLEECPEVDGILNLLVLQLGKDVMVAVKAKMIHHDSQDDFISSINRCERKMKERFSQVVWSFFEPDNKD